MKGLPLTADPHTLSTAPSRTRSSSSRAHLLLVLLVFGLISFRNSTASLDISGVGEVWREIKWAVTPLPKVPKQRALRLLERQPIIDGHIDLPILARWYYGNQVNDPDFDLRKDGAQGQVDIPRLKKGRVGGFFWSVYVGCPEDAGFPNENASDSNFTSPSFRVRDTIEQIDTARLLIDKYPDTFKLVKTAKEWRNAFKKGKVGGMLGVEGGHQLGASLATLRTYYALGARYVTFTHTCNSPLGDSCGAQGHPIPSRWNGLSSFGATAIKEMNRLGMMVDLSHTHPKTASDALSVSQAPVIFSHSNARGLHDVVRNIPDSILRRIGNIEGKKTFNLSEDGEKGKGWGAESGEVDLEIPGGDLVIMLNFAPGFVSEWDDGTGPRANVSLMADHADYIGRLAGRQYVGIGSDFDGIESVPEGLEDVSTYPNLIAELIRRGWTDAEIRGVASGNLLRVLEKVEAVSHKLKHVQPYTDIFQGRADLKKHDAPPFVLSRGEEEL